jgi:hypothetical protein
VRTKTCLVLAVLAVLARERHASAETSLSRTAPAPAPSDAPEAWSVDRSVAPPSRPRTRIGVLGGVGFPRPIAVEGLVDVGDVFAVGAEYGVLPTVTIDGVATSLWSLAVDARLFPLRGPFFVALRAGRQHVGATTHVAIESLGSALEVLSLDSWFLNPCVGVLWTSRAGLAFGVDVGIQIPVSPSVTSTLPLSLYPSAQRTIDTLGKSVLPTLDLLRVGLLL